MTRFGPGRSPSRWRAVLAASAAALAVSIAPPISSAISAERPGRAVLILIPRQPTGTQAGVDAFATAARAALLKALPVGSSVYIEYTDLAGLGVPEQGKLRDWYGTKYSRHPIDLIIGGGQEARSFLLRFRDELWPTIPVIFAGMAE